MELVRLSRRLGWPHTVTGDTVTSPHGWSWTDTRDSCPSGVWVDGASCCSPSLSSPARALLSRVAGTRPSSTRTEVDPHAKATLGPSCFTAAWLGCSSFALVAKPENGGTTESAGSLLKVSSRSSALTTWDRREGGRAVCWLMPDMPCSVEPAAFDEGEVVAAAIGAEGSSVEEAAAGSEGADGDAAEACAGCGA